ncbi:TetR/AcrR family transcriptional regulator [Amnibacterium setariae]|uniref:TetR/AcrR family transcriptional regulator n=1 Tax=Amnibacterium setariae TaxID=2306585 RepID=A0A3A1U1K9_9MICO|nr:TetR/AcrR family transcriptional regulator [Amnibacterium setariae]RIX30253.1 TetR/AcrR family transcriptional regulator [Amnibacterium setariae]
MAVESRDALRERITREAGALLAHGGPGAVTTRGVAEAAGVQAPTIYRLFGDKDGLLEAVAEHTMAAQVEAKARYAETTASKGVEPVEDVREAWAAQIEFGLENPALFRLLSDPERVRHSAAARAGREVLDARIHRIAAAGRLRVDEERAADLMQAAGIGVIQNLLAHEEGDRDRGLSEAMLDAVLAQILHGGEPAADDPTVAAAVALRAAAPELPGLTAPERQLLAEWLDRVVRAR